MTGDLEYRIRELLRDLCECRQHVPRSTELENSLVLAMTGFALNRPSSMARCQDAHVDFLIEETEQFMSLVSTITLETHDGFSGPQRSSFRKIVVDLRRDLERFTSDALLIIGDKQEIRRRIQAG
ncbi:hypothetical protein [Sphingomonas sp. Mn802worker]|uniref:hypothetical protein n=1 Tax=Sphingomonas sp. Mn802worker TaxID=629773 RepID=UPI0003652F11|nr:hypothetical protein [Sphingomonas sp. Mn802worker]